jgi:hypothetical protein
MLNNHIREAIKTAFEDRVYEGKAIISFYKFFIDSLTESIFDENEHLAKLFVDENLNELKELFAEMLNFN